MGESLWAICVYLVCGQDYVIVIECNNLLNPIPVSCFMSKYDKWYSLESSYALLKEFPKISLQNLCNPFSYVQKANIYQNLTTKSGSKQIFRLLKEKSSHSGTTQAVSINARF